MFAQGKGNIFFFLSFLVVFYFATSVSSQPTKNVTDIIRSYGYQTEEHWVLTLDGYYLLMNRILTTGKPKAVVYFQHGLTDCSVGICLLPKQSGLPWALVDQGYEVWLGNNRGNGYSMRHVKYTPVDYEFWDFSWQDMAEFDFPAMISYVLSVSRFSKLTYIGHSEGTIQAFAGLINRPEIASKLSMYIALAPVGYVAHLGGVVMRTLADLDVDIFVELFGLHEFSLPQFIEKVLPNLCQYDPSACYFPLELLMGPSKHENVSRIPYILGYEPNPTSVKNMMHWAQSTRAGTFSKFDYGLVKNLEEYGTAKPPPYKFSNFPANLTTVLFTGIHDYLADPTDVQRMLSELPFSPIVYETDYGHVDFIWGDDAPTKVYKPILQLLQKFSSRS